MLPGGHASRARCAHERIWREGEDDAPTDAATEGVNSSDKEDPWAEANLLHGLPEDRARHLKTLSPPPPPPGHIPRSEGTLDCAVNPWQSMHAPLAWPDAVDHGQVASIQGAEHKAQRSLMHRCALADCRGVLTVR